MSAGQILDDLEPKRGYPAVITAEELERQAHLSDDEVENDVNDTLREMVTAARVRGVESRDYTARRDFVAYLRRLQRARQEHSQSVVADDVTFRAAPEGTTKP